MDTVGTRTGFTVIVIELLVAVVEVKQPPTGVITQLMISLFEREEVVNVVVPEPMFVPFFFH